MNELSPSVTSSSTAQGDAKPPFSVTRLDPVAGAEIHGIALSKLISPETRDAILDAFVENHVLVFRDQDLTKDEQHAFTKNFGELEQQYQKE